VRLKVILENRLAALVAIHHMINRTLICNPQLLIGNWFFIGAHLLDAQRVRENWFAPFFITHEPANGGWGCQLDVLSEKAEMPSPET